MEPKQQEIREELLRAAMDHVAFDGWSETTYRAAVAQSRIDAQVARAACPRGAVDLALCFHALGDEEMLRRMAATAPAEMRFRDRIAQAVRFRIEAIEDKEAVRRASSLFALPQNAALGAGAIWGTADRIWSALGDASRDVNWYTKRATLSGVYGATVLYWLGDDSEGQEATWTFLDRRIDDVMQIEKVKAQVNESPLLRGLLAGPNWLASRIKAPGAHPPAGMPGHWAPEGPETSGGNNS
ncbi:COQ9 family protein [Harenicola maris]|uniref:COQ9 family protein n=1 Tax=Harenicola maris TaxID=2841044 RepID=UPI00389951AF